MKSMNVVGALGGFLLNRAGDVIKNNRTLDNVGVSFFFPRGLVVGETASFDEALIASKHHGIC